MALDQVSVVLGGSVIVDRDSLRLAAGEVVLLLGRSGTGKSVLIKAVVGFIPLAGGSIVLQGRAVDPFKQPHLVRREVVLVHQDAALLDEETVLDNVTLPLRWRSGVSRADAEARARKELIRVGMEAMAGQRALDLSAGERKLVCLARAVAMDPRVLLLDEPITGLDVAASLRVGQTIRSIAGTGTALLVVTHDLDPFKDVAHRVCVLGRGGLVSNDLVPAAWEKPGAALHQFMTAAIEGPLTERTTEV